METNIENNAAPSVDVPRLVRVAELIGSIVAKFGASAVRPG
jgi:hypothetical protein